MKILIADRLLVGKPHADWKEGWELFYAIIGKGHHATIAGPGCPVSEAAIPIIAPEYDLIMITDNYPHGAWRWWDWAAIKTPKMFYAVDTHVKEFRAWAPGFVEIAKIDIVACNNPRDMGLFPGSKTFWLPLAASKMHFGAPRVAAERNLAFIGSPTDDRLALLDRIGKVDRLMAFGDKYVQEMQKSKICLNIPISYDINAKYFEIPASGTFMLGKEHPELQAILKNDSIQRMFWKDEKDLVEKIAFFLEHNEDREHIVEDARSYILTNHVWENRVDSILEFLTTLSSS